VGSGSGSGAGWKNMWALFEPPALFAQLVRHNLTNAKINNL